MYHSQSADAVEQRQILLLIRDILLELGYDPVRQIAGYLLSEDPTYIPDHCNARALIEKIDREFLLSTLVRGYLATK